jgi:hypothetical protein
MSDFSITQEQIDSLLNEVSIEDRVLNQFTKVKNKISRMLHSNTSRELLQIKKDLSVYMKALEENRPYSLDFINSFKADYKNFSNQILQRTNDYTLFEFVVKLENMIGAMFYNMAEERRRYPRFPLTVDQFLTEEEETHTLFGADISSVGLSFFAPLQLEIGRRITLSTPPPQNHELQVDVLRVARIEPEQLNVWRTACAFPNLLSWEDIRRIITGVVESGD